MSEDNYYFKLSMVSNGETFATFPVFKPIESISFNRESEYVSDSKKRIFFPNTAHDSIDIKLNDEDFDFNNILGVDSTHDFKVEVKYQVGVQQTRRHKKKRINKKWAKRYGTRPIYNWIEIPRCRSSYEDDTNTYHGEILPKW